jgi:hypothetical protein
MALASPASPSSVAPHAVPTTSAAPHMGPTTSVTPHVVSTTPPPPVPRAAPVSTTLAAPPTAPTSQFYRLHYSRSPRAMWEPPSPPLHQQSSPMKVVLMAHLVNPHPMTTWVKQGFRLLTDRLTLSATSASTLLPVPSSVRAALINPNWLCAMEEEIDALIANNTWDLVPCLIGSNVITDKWVLTSSRWL